MRLFGPESYYFNVGKYDVASKSGAIRDPRGFLFMIGRVDLTGEVREELAISERAVIAAEVPDHKHLPLRVSIAVMKEEGCPDKIPVEFRVDRGDVGHWVRPRLTRLFALDPKPILRLRRPALLPWVGLMKGTTEAELAEAARGVASDDELAAQFAVLAGVRWERELIDLLLGRFGSMLTVDVAAKTPFGNEILQRGIEKGIEKGIERGVVEGEQESIRLFLESRFPALAGSGLGHITTRTQAQTLLKELYAAATEDEARHALRAE